MARGYSKDWPLSNWCCHWLGVAGITIKQDMYKVRPAAPPVVFVGLSTPLTIVVSDISAIFPINPSYWSYKSSLLSSGAPPCVYIYTYKYIYIYILYYIYNILYIYMFYAWTALSRPVHNSIVDQPLVGTGCIFHLRSRVHFSSPVI